MLPTRPNTKRQRKPDTPILTRDHIAQAALTLVDRDGIEAFSMRNLASELGVYPTAIYWHIPGRNAVIAAMLTLVLKDMAPELENDDWKEFLRQLFTNFRDRIKAHPSVAPIMGSQLVSNGALDFPMIESILEALRVCGFSDNTMPGAFNVVITGMVGYTTQEFGLVPADDRVEWAESMKTEIMAVDQDAHPLVGALLPKLVNKSFILRWTNGVEAPLNDGFELYVETIIDGLEAQALRQAQ